MPSERMKRKIERYNRKIERYNRKIEKLKEIISKDAGALAPTPAPTELPPGCKGPSSPGGDCSRGTGCVYCANQGDCENERGCFWKSHGVGCKLNCSHFATHATCISGDFEQAGCSWSPSTGCFCRKGALGGCVPSTLHKRFIT